MGMGNAAQRCGNGKTEKRPRLWDPPVRRYIGMGMAEPGMGQPTPYRLNSSKDNSH
jgi:hypothetical protein